MKRIFKKINIICFLFFLQSCSSYERFKLITEELEIPSKIFLMNFQQTWQAVLQVIKKYDIEYQSLESGVIRTRWIDNTSSINFTDSYGNDDSFVKEAKFKLIVNITKGSRGGEEISRVAIYKRQLVEQDFLQGWKEIPSNKIQEKILLYRVKRVLDIEEKLKAIEKKRQEEELKTLF